MPIKIPNSYPLGSKVSTVVSRNTFHHTEVCPTCGFEKPVFTMGQESIQKGTIIGIRYYPEMKRKLYYTVLTDNYKELQVTHDKLTLLDEE